MNELIKELAEQAGFYFYNMHDVDGQDLGETIEADSWSAAERFAELIVQECVARTQGCHLAEGYDPEIVGDFELGYKRAIDKVSKQVLLHFGLK